MSSKACSETRVVHWKKEQCTVRIDRPSKWSNPYTHLPIGRTQAKFQVATREAAIASFVCQYLPTRPDLLESLLELDGEILGCWCHPKKCHGDELVRLVALTKRLGRTLTPADLVQQEQQSLF